VPSLSWPYLPSPDEDDPKRSSRIWANGFCPIFFTRVTEAVQAPPGTEGMPPDRHDRLDLVGSILGRWTGWSAAEDLQAARAILRVARLVCDSGRVATEAGLEGILGRPTAGQERDTLRSLASSPTAPPLAEACIICLLVWDPKEADPASDGPRGVTAQLHVQLIPGRGETYPAVDRHWYLSTDESFDRALSHALAAVDACCGLALPRTHDMRWRLAVDPSLRITTFPELNGPSMGLAFALCAARVLSKHSAKPYAGLDLVQVATSASLDADGGLVPVGELWAKLGARARQLADYGQLRLLLVADRQDGIPSEFRDKGGGPFDVARATSLVHGIEVLEENSRSRQSVTAAMRRRCEQLEVAVTGERRLMSEAYLVLPLFEKVTGTASGGEADGERDASEGGTGFLSARRMSQEDAGRVPPGASDPRYVRRSVRELLRQDGRSAPARVAVIAPPGSGKSSFLQHVVLENSTDSESPGTDGRRRIPVILALGNCRGEFRTWEGTPPRLTRIAELLAATYQDVEYPPEPERWRQWLADGDLLLCLDGLDEAEDCIEMVRTGLMECANQCPVVVTCRSAAFERHQHVFHGFRKCFLGDLSDDQVAQYVENFTVGSRKERFAQVVMECLRSSPQLESLTTNPLLLSMLCSVAEAGRAGPNRTVTVTSLLDETLDVLIRRTKPHAHSMTQRTLRLGPDMKRMVAERVALKLSTDKAGARQLAFDRRRLQSAFTESLRELGGVDPRSVGEVANNLIVDATRNWLLRHDGRLYRFAHPLIQDFLTASAIARIADEEGWQAELPVGALSGNVLGVLDRKAWDPGWADTFRFIAGLLEPGVAVELIGFLADRRRDDVYRHRLAMAVTCLGEMRNPPDGLADRLTVAAFSFLYRHWLAGAIPSGVPHIAPLVEHFSPILSTMARLNRPYHGLPLVSWLCRKMAEGREKHPTGNGDPITPAYALVLMGMSTLMRPEVMAAFAEAMAGEDDERAPPVWLVFHNAMLMNERHSTQVRRVITGVKSRIPVAISPQRREQVLRSLAEVETVAAAVGGRQQVDSQPPGGTSTESEFPQQQDSGPSVVDTSMRQIASLYDRGQDEFAYLRLGSDLCSIYRHLLCINPDAIGPVLTALRASPSGCLAGAWRDLVGACEEVGLTGKVVSGVLDLWEDGLDPEGKCVAAVACCVRDDTPEGALCSWAFEVAQPQACPELRDNSQRVLATLAASISETPRAWSWTLTALHSGDHGDRTTALRILADGQLSAAGRRDLIPAAMAEFRGGDTAAVPYAALALCRIGGVKTAEREVVPALLHRLPTKNRQEQILRMQVLHDVVSSFRVEPTVVVPPVCRVLKRKMDYTATFLGLQILLHYAGVPEVGSSVVKALGRGIRHGDAVSLAAQLRKLEPYRMCPVVRWGMVRALLSGVAGKDPRAKANGKALLAHLLKGHRLLGRGLRTRLVPLADLCAHQDV
jgi:hypothetical protein